MIAYKGFNQSLACTRGKGTFQYEVGKTYKEESAKCASTGFHCVEEPIEVLTWYSGISSRYCIVEALGDVHEDGSDKISCTEMKIVKEINLQQLGILECEWIRQHPNRNTSHHVKNDNGQADKNGIVIVRGKNPKAKGETGSTLFLLKEDKDSNEIVEIGVYQIDGTNYKPGIYYKADGR